MRDFFPAFDDQAAGLGNWRPVRNGRWMPGVLTLIGGEDEPGSRAETRVISANTATRSIAKKTASAQTAAWTLPDSRPVAARSPTANEARCARHEFRRAGGSLTNCDRRPVHAGQLCACRARQPQADTTAAAGQVQETLTCAEPQPGDETAKSPPGGHAIGLQLAGIVSPVGLAGQTPHQLAVRRGPVGTIECLRCYPRTGGDNSATQLAVCHGGAFPLIRWEYFSMVVRERLGAKLITTESGGAGWTSTRSGNRDASRGHQRPGSRHRPGTLAGARSP
jgi:hypothetical protein